MDLTRQIAKLFKDTYYGDNWTDVDFKKNLANLSWQEATTKVYSFNTIADLIFHTNYYIITVSAVLEGKTLGSGDKNSFAHPPILSKEDWEKLLNETWALVDKLAMLIEQMPESKLWEIFSDEKYGNYYRNIHGVIEHCYYHLGQIVLIKKILHAADKN